MADDKLESPISHVSHYDHAPRFIAFEQNQVEISARVEQLLVSHEPQPVIIDDPNKKLLLSEEEIRRLWGLFPPSARSRAVPNLPILKSGEPKWFARGSSERGPVITDSTEEALSATAHGMAHTDEDGSIILHEIPENGFSSEVKRLVQTGVLVHELAHTITNPELNERSPERALLLLPGKVMSAVEWITIFGQLAERYPPISRYSAAYRNIDGTFPQEDGIYLGTPILEELVDSITAELLGYVVDGNGLNFEPFKNREEIQDSIQEYLKAQVAVAE
jgi:hypothetical protein